MYFIYLFIFVPSLDLSWKPRLRNLNEKSNEKKNPVYLLMAHQSFCPPWPGLDVITGRKRRSGGSSCSTQVGLVLNSRTLDAHCRFFFVFCFGEGGSRTVFKWPSSGLSYMEMYSVWRELTTRVFIRRSWWRSLVLERGFMEVNEGWIFLRDASWTVLKINQLMAARGLQVLT